MLELRDYPFPFKSMLAICSDLDETPSAAEYFAISSYLNSDTNTPIGKGVSLEVGNTLYFDMAPGQFAYWGAGAADQERARALIRSGHIDCFHSYGDLANSRAHAGRALEELARYDCAIHAWVDHAVAPTNFGPDIMLGRGDVKSDPAYHADLTVSQGLRYVWIGRVTSCIGQEVAYSATTGIRQERSASAFINTAKGIAKQLKASLGDGKYAMHQGNGLTRRYTLRDGHELTEFIRCNPHPHGVSVGDHSQGFGDALNEAALEHLVRRRGASVIYTHLGKHVTGDQLFPHSTRRAFERLSERQKQGDILVATTLRLLDYHAAKKSTRIYNKETHLELELPENLPADGLTWAWNSSATPRVLVNGAEIAVERHETSSRVWLSVPWPKLTYPL